MDRKALNLGVCGLGRAFLLTAPALLADPRIALVAAADPRGEARARFEADFQAPSYEDLDSLLADGDVEVVYIASPHALHAPQAIAAARARKHVLVEKPMALGLADADAMIAAARAAGVALMVGPSHGLDAPVRQAAELIASGQFGAPRTAAALNYTDFLYRPRRPEELDPRAGGGAVLTQAPHQIDIVRRLIGAPVRAVRAAAHVFDAARPVEGAYNAFLAFDGGASASLVYGGHDHFDSDEFMGWAGETGQAKDAAVYAAARRSLAPPGGLEAEQRRARAFGDGVMPPPPKFHEHFGLAIVSCERADLRLMPTGVMVYGDAERRLHPLEPPLFARRAVVDELWSVIREGREPAQGGEWGRSTLEICLAILASSRQSKEIELTPDLHRGREGAMGRIALSLACWNYDRVRALIDGRVTPAGIDLNFMALPVEETFFRMLRHGEFDAAELSLSSYCVSLMRKGPPFIAIPVFPSRFFRHGCIFVSARGRVRDPGDLAGARVGTPEFQMTAPVWIRGILADDYGVDPAAPTYLTGGEEEPGRGEKLRLDLPERFRVSPIGPAQTLSAMLAEGEIDALYTARAPSTFYSRPDAVRRLFDDPSAVERAYFRRTGIFPIMHVIALRRDVYERHRWIARSLLDAFVAAKELAYAELKVTASLQTMLPFQTAAVEEAVREMGADWWSYGLAANRPTLETFLRYHHEQALSSRLLAPEELFAPETLETFKIEE